MRVQPIALLFLAFAAGCASVQVMSDWDREVDFAKYRTYRWAPTDASQVETGGTHFSLLDKRIRHAVDRELQAKGLTLRESGDADAMFVYQIKVRDKIDVYQDSGYWRYGSSSVDAYREGTLALLMVDPQMEEQVVWQGWAVGIVEQTPDESDAKVNEAVAKMFLNFPPQ